jgi:hypothetical protein
MISHLYRYRPTKYLLGEFEELEAQQIYFCPPRDLNDPMEGFKDLCWLGDDIVWRNLLRHYILTMINIFPICTLGEPFSATDVLENFIFATPDDLPVAPVRNVYDKAAKAFLSEPAVVSFVDLMHSRTVPIRRSELINYLRALHPFAIAAVYKEFSKNGLPVPSAPSEGLGTLRDNAIRMMKSASALPGVDNANPLSAEAFFSANESIIEQLSLVREYQTSDRATTQGITFFCHYFSSAYVGALNRLVHRDLYVASFSANPTNASMWGQYGDGHRGVCLMFKTSLNSRGVPSLNLNQITSLHGGRGENEYSWSFVPHEFQKITYDPTFPAIDFFQSLGGISQMSLNRFWYRGENGTASACRDTAFKDQSARDEYWRLFESGALFKTREWQHEEEYRVLLHSGFDLRETPMRRLEYKFEDLSGIVFGARTDMEDKLKIMRVIDQKCAKEHRSDFQFFEVRYAADRSEFRFSPLGLVKIKYG